jgi:hypothetical protein
VSNKLARPPSRASLDNMTKKELADYLWADRERSAANPVPAETGWVEKVHGVDCPKVTHIGSGYLHDADDDKPYDVDGVMYCGRCHGWLG